VIYIYRVNFLYPAFLIAGLAIAIPIIIHLFNFKRYKKVLFSDIRLLQEIKEQTNKSSQLKHIITLLMRIGVIASLVLAFAQPFLGDASAIKKGKRATSIFVDNSYSMGVQQGGVPALELAKSKAKDIISSCANNEQFQILTHDFTGSDTRFLNKEEALAYLATISMSANNKEVATILQKQHNNLQTSEATTKQIVYISDMQKNKFDLPIKSTISTPTFFVPISKATSANVSLDSVWFAEPSINMNQPNNLQVRLRNYDQERPIETSVTVEVNGQIKSVKNVTLAANSNKLEDIAFTANQSGWQNIAVRISDYPISFDDTFYLAGKVSAQQNVLLISEGVSNPYLNAVFKTSASFNTEVATGSNATSKKLSNYSLVICSGLNTISSSLADVLSSYCNAGGSVVVYPGNNINGSSYNEALSKLGGASIGALDASTLTVSTVNKQHELIRDIFDRIPDNVDLPKTEKRYILGSSTFSTEQKIFSYSNGESFLSSYKLGNGKVYLCASGLDAGSTNFANSYWFLPVMFKMAFIGSNNPIYSYTLGKDELLNISNSKGADNNPFHLSSKGWDAIPQQRTIGSGIQINLKNSAQYAGLYDLSLPNSEADKYVLGLNYDRAESNPNCWANNELQSKVGLSNFKVLDGTLNPAAALGDAANGNTLWRTMLILALIFLAAEVLLLRLWK
jgi:hypothetical protein